MIFFCMYTLAFKKICATKAFINEVEKSPVDGKNMFRGQEIPAMGMPDFSELLRNIFGMTHS